MTLYHQGRSAFRVLSTRWKISIILAGIVFVVIGAMGQSIQATQTTSGQLIWPLSRELGDRVFIQMHPDLDRDEGEMDYKCGGLYTYDGHRGTDFTLYNFRYMDEGVAIYAAASGTVAFVRHDEFDREYWPPVISEPNGISIQGPGFDHQYWHMRTDSISVKVGDVVRQGDFLGYIGSSGQTAIPHLHFEVWDGYGGTWAFRDPFGDGDCADSPAMWDAIGYDHPGDKQFALFDTDIFNKRLLKGNEANNYFGELVLKDRPFRPVVYGADEQFLGVWTQFQGDPGTLYDVVVVKPDGSEFGRQTKWTPLTNQGFQWQVFYFNFSRNVSDADYGEWVVNVELGGEVLQSVPFEVGETSVYGPRFYPLAGKSFRLSGEEIRDDLSLSGLEEGEVTFALVDAPEFVSIDDNEVVISAQADPEFRNTFFRVTVTDSEGGFDTKRYHLVDVNKPFRRN